MYIEKVKETIDEYSRSLGKEPDVIRMTQSFYDELVKELEERYHVILLLFRPQIYGYGTIFGIPIEIVDDDEIN